MDFPTTNWTRIAAASLHGEGRRAMDELCRAYYVPVRRFVEWRRGGQDSEDITQAFFLHVLDHGLVHHADRMRGRFRTFLLTILSRFLIHHDRALAAEKRGGKIEFLPLEDSVTELCADTEEVSRFDREWAVALMDTASDRIGTEIRKERGAEAFEVLRRFLGIGQEPQTYETAATLLGVTSSAVKTEILRWRRRLGELVRSEVGKTVATPQEVEEEIAHLRRALLE